MPSTIKEILDQQYKKRPIMRSGRVTARPLSTNGQSLGYVTCEIAGQQVNVRTWPDQNLFVGDWISVEQIGNGAGAVYRADSWMMGPRPNSQGTQFTADTTIGNLSYQAGDLLWGDPFKGHFDLDYSEGTIWLRSATTNTGYLNAVTGVFGAGDPNKVHGEFSASAIEWKNGAEVLTAWDVEGRSIYGIERLGRPLGPCIEWGPITDPSGDPALERWGLWVRDQTERFFVVYSGNDVDPSAAGMRVGAQGDINYLEWKEGTLTVAGNLKVGSLGDTSGWEITTGKLTSTNIGMATAAGDATYAFWAGDNTPANAEFSVAHTGAMKATAANISGSISATSGSIGDWTITPTALYHLDTGAPGATPVNGITLETAGGTNSAPVIRVYDDTTLNAALGNYATGKYGLYAHEGEIGGWYIYDTSLASLSGTVGMSSLVTGAPTTDIRFWAGALIGNTPPFRVLHNGNLIATSASITGDIVWGNSKGTLTATGFDYTYGAGDFVKVDATAATDGILRVSALGTTFTNGVNIAVDSAGYCIYNKHTDCRSGGGAQSIIEVGGTGGIGSVGYGFYTNVIRKADSSVGGYLFGYLANVASDAYGGEAETAYGYQSLVYEGGQGAIAHGYYTNTSSSGTNGVAYGFKADVSAAGTGGSAYTFSGTGGPISNTHGAVINEGGNDSDTRIESDTEANMVFVDAGADLLYLGGNTNAIKITKGGILSGIGTGGVAMPHMMQSDGTDQAIANVANAQVITFDADIHHQNITRTSASRFTVTQAGSYLICFSGIAMSAVAGKVIEVWLRVDGSDITSSNTRYQFKAVNASAVIAVSFIQYFTAGQYFEFWTWGDDTGVKWDATAAGTSPTRPATPSIIMTCNMVSKD